jgi:methylglyoxal synthase
MSLIFIPQKSNKMHNWVPKIVENSKLIENIHALVEHDSMKKENVEFYVNGNQFTCEKFTSNTGTSSNIVFSKIKGQ